MAKQRTPEQEAIRAAKKVPPKHFHMSKHICWIEASWPCAWNFMTDWTSFSIDIGESKNRFHSIETPDPVFLFCFMIKPLEVSCFWKNRMLFSFGNSEWIQ